MSEKDEMGSADFFDEVQEKVEQEMFLDGGLSGEGDAVKLTQSSVPRREAPVVENDMDDIEDPDLFEGDLDDALFDEIDAVQSGVKMSAASFAADQTTPARALAEPPDGFDLDPARDDLGDLREDDLMLGELIDSEMIDPREKGGGPAEGDPAQDAPAGESAAQPQGGTRDALDTRTLGDLYATQGLYRKAVTIYEKLAAESPGNRQLLERLGELRLAAARETGEPVHQADPVYAGTAPKSLRDPQMVLVKRLEAWLDHIQAEKERRCSQSS